MCQILLKVPLFFAMCMVVPGFLRKFYRPDKSLKCLFNKDVIDSLFAQLPSSSAKKIKKITARHEVSLVAGYSRLAKNPAGNVMTPRLKKPFSISAANYLAISRLSHTKSLVFDFHSGAPPPLHFLIF